MKKNFILLCFLFSFFCFQSLFGQTNALPPPKKIGIALAGGGALGFVHIGVLKVLEENHIPLHVISGTSMGSIVGGLSALGYSSKELEKLVLNIDWIDLFTNTNSRDANTFQQKNSSLNYLGGFQFDDKGLLTPNSLLPDTKINDLLNLITLPYNETDFSHFQRPFVAVATDLSSGNAVILKNGSLALAMRASMAVPGAFSPVHYGDLTLVDGGLVKNLPADILKDYDCDFIIGVDIHKSAAPAEIKAGLLGVADVLSQSVDILFEQNVKQQRALCNLLISPAIPDGFTSSSFDKAKELIAAGEAAAKKVLPELVALRDNYNSLKMGEGQIGGPSRKQFSLDSIQFSGLQFSDHDLAQPFLNLPPGSPYDPISLQKLIAPLRSTGHYESINFECQKTGDKRFILKIILSPMKKAVNDVQIGFSAFRREEFDDLDGGIQFDLHLVEQNWGDNKSSFETNAWLGSKNGLDFIYRQNLGWPGHFCPEMYFYQDELLYHPDGNEEIHNIKHWGSQLSLNRTILRWAQFEAGLRLEGFTDQDLTANSIYSEEAGQAFGFYVSQKYDTLNRMPFPRAGAFLQIDYLSYLSKIIGNVNYQRLNIESRIFIPLIDRLSIQWHSILGSNFNTTPCFWDGFTLGGVNSIPGYITAEFSGTQLFFESGELSWELPFLPSIAKDKVFLTLTGAGGNTWTGKLDSWKQNHQIYYGGSLGLGFDLSITAFKVDFGLNDKKHFAAYLQVGKVF